MKNPPSVKIEKIKPKYYGQKCPVCNGFGTLKYGELRCHACASKGYILIPAREEGQTDGREEN